MKYKHLVVGTAFLVLPQIAGALDFNIQPRLDTGAVYFEFDQRSIVVGDRPLDPSPSRIDGFKLSDTMPFFRGGLTFFADRFFVDVDVQHAFGGSDTGRFTTSAELPAGTIPGVPLAIDAVADNRIDSDFHRTEFAVSAGYAVTEHLVVFAGYKRAETNFDMNVLADLEGVTPNNIPVKGLATGSYDVDFIYDGPFIGAANTWEIRTDFIEGGLTANVGVAFLDGKTRLRFGDFLFSNEFIETNVNPSVLLAAPLKGDTIGISLGLQWLGFTPMKGLTYSVGVNGYRYDFDGKNSADFTDTLVRFSAGLQYLF